MICEKQCFKRTFTQCQQKNCLKSLLRNNNAHRIRVNAHFLTFSPNDAMSPMVFCTSCVTSCTATTRSFSDFFSSCKRQNASVTFRFPSRVSGKPG